MHDRFPDIQLDDYVVMPNHIHAILFIVWATVVVTPDNIEHDENKMAGIKPAPTG